MLQHETATCKMFDHLVKSNKLEPLMEKYGLVLSEDLIFIKEMIEPKKVTDPVSHYTVSTGRVNSVISQYHQCYKCYTKQCLMSLLSVISTVAI